MSKFSSVLQGYILVSLARVFFKYRLIILCAYKQFFHFCFSRHKQYSKYSKANFHVRFYNTVYFMVEEETWKYIDPTCQLLFRSCVSKYYTMYKKRLHNVTG